MAIKYPASIDTTTTIPEFLDGQPITASRINGLREAIIAIETELGVRPSLLSTTVRARLDTMDGTLSGLQIIKLATDLSGTINNPQVVGIRGNPISTNAPTIGDVLSWSGTSWTPVPGSLAFLVFSGDLSGNLLHQNVIGIQSKPLQSSLSTIGATQDGYILTWINGDGYWEAKPPAISFTAGGDLSGTNVSQILSKLQGKTLGLSLGSVGATQDGYQLTWVNSASEWQAKKDAAGFTAGGDLTGTPTVQRVQQLTGVISLEQYGAVGDGITNDNAAWVAALAALTGATGSGNHTIQLGSNRNYLVNVGGVLPAGCSIIGYGDSSILSTTGNGSLIRIGGQNCSLINFKMLGNGTGGSQIAVANKDLNAGNGYQFFKMYGCIIDNFAYCGAMFYMPIGDATSHGVQVSDCIIRNCANFGWWLFAEYSTYTNLQALQCGTGINFAAGNVVLTGGIITNCTTGLLLNNGGGNDGQGVITGMEINHNATNITTLTTFNSIQNGQTLVDCMIYSGTIQLINSFGIRFIGCQIDCPNLFFQGSTGTQFIDCVFPQGVGTVGIFNSYGGQASTTYWNNCRDLNGNVPLGIIAAYDGTNWQNSIDGYISLGSSPTSVGLIKMEDLVTNSATGQTLTVRAQNATGTTSIGGNLVLSSGTGTTHAGSVILNYGSAAVFTASSSALTIATPTSVGLSINSNNANCLINVTGSNGLYMSSLTHVFRDVAAATWLTLTGLSTGASTATIATGVTSFIMSQADNSTASATGAVTTIQAQNATGTTTNGGNLVLQSGTGTTATGLVYIKTGAGTAATFSQTTSAITGSAQGSIAGGSATLTLTSGGTGSIYSISNLYLANTSGASSNAIGFNLNDTGATNIAFSLLTTPTIKQNDNITNSGTGAVLTVQAQNATGTTSTGGNLVLQSGAGTSTDGYIAFKLGSVERARIESAFGIGVFGGNAGGTAFKAHLGPLTGFETSNSALWLIAPATTRTANNPVIYSDGLGCNFNTPNASSAMGFVAGGATFRMYLTTTAALFFGTTTANSRYYLDNSATSMFHFSNLSTSATILGDLQATTPSPMNIQAANVTTGIGSDLTLQSGTGSVHDGYVFIKTGNTTAATFAPTGITLGLPFTSISVGTTPLATVGDIRGSKTLSAYARNSTNTGNLNAFNFNGTDSLTFGDVNVATMDFVSAGASVLASGSYVQLKGTQTYIATTGGVNTIRLLANATTSNINFLQTNAAIISIDDITGAGGGTAANLTIHAGNELGLTSIGGNLILNAGTGTSSNGYITTTSNWKMGDTVGSPSATVGSAAGTQLLFRDDSEIRFRSGATTYGGMYMTAGNIYFGSYSSAASFPVNTYFDCQTATYFRVLGGTYLKIDTTIGIIPAVANLQWITSPAGGSPVISQADLTTNSGTAQALTIHAQNATGTTSTGGNLVLQAGTGTTTGGDVNATGKHVTLTATTGGYVNLVGLGHIYYDADVHHFRSQGSAALLTISTTLATSTVPLQVASGGDGTINSGLYITRSGSGSVLMGPYNSGFDAIWFHGAAAAPTASNWAFLGSGADTYFNAPSSQMYFGVGTAYHMSMTASVLNIGLAYSTPDYIFDFSHTAIQHFTVNATSATIKYDDAASGAGKLLSIIGQKAATGVGGNVVIQSGAGTGGADGYINLDASATVIAQVNSTGLTLFAGLTLHTNTVSSAAFTVDSSGNNCVIYADTSGTAITITLPVPTAGRSIIIKDSGFNASINNITIAQHATEKIEGVAASRIFSANGAVIVLNSNGTDWFILN